MVQPCLEHGEVIRGAETEPLGEVHGGALFACASNASEHHNGCRMFGSGDIPIFIIYIVIVIVFVASGRHKDAIILPVSLGIDNKIFFIAEDDDGLSRFFKDV